MKNKSWALLFAFSLLVVGSGIVNLISLSNQSIRLDESQSLWVATKSVPSILRYIAQDVHVPLYSVVLHYWIQFFGTDIMASRLLSLLFYLATIPFLYILAKESSNKKVALVTVAMFSLSPFMAWYSNEARMYTLFTLVTTINNIHFLRFVRSEGQKSKLAYIISAVFSMYTHYFSLFLLLSQFVFVAGLVTVRVYKESKLKKISVKSLINTHKKLLLFYIGISASAFAFLIPWLLYVVGQGSASNMQPMIPRPSSFNVFQTIVQFLFGFQNQSVQAFIIAIWPLSLIMLFLLFTKRRKIPTNMIEYFALATILPIVVVFVISFVRPIFLSRYLILVTPTLFYILAWTFLSYSRKMARLFVTTILLVMAFLSIYQGISAMTPVREDYSGVSKYLTESTTPRDIIAVSAPFTVYPIEYTYQGQARITTIPEWNRYVQGSIPEFTTTKLEKQINEYKTQYTKVYVVLSYDQGYENKIKDYMDKRFELSKAQKFSQGLEVRSYILRYDLGY
ncbi:MAG: glycosyltransferase family 39 protein [bacterium]|nr:glycosyltransferase family 39 protein [bacterium]